MVMKKQLFIVLALAGFLLPEAVYSYNGDSANNSEQKELNWFNSANEAAIYSVYQTFSEELGGMEIRTDVKGLPCQGWVRDYYDNGQLLHKGYYVEGRLKIFKNYYENGNIERIYRIKSFRKSKMKIFYADGKPKSVIEYYKGNPRLWKEFYYPYHIEGERLANKD